MEILIVGDSSVDGICHSLELAGNSVHVAPTAKEARQWILDHQPDILICDLTLPDSGPCETIVWLHTKVDIPTIATSDINLGPQAMSALQNVPAVVRFWDKEKPQVLLRFVEITCQILSSLPSGLPPSRVALA